MVMGEHLCLENDNGQVIDTDILYEVLRRVDGVTLARAACASSTLYTVCSNEALWEHACNQRWPSTTDPEVKAIVSSLGGFHKFYGECFLPIFDSIRPSIFDKVAEPVMASRDMKRSFDGEEVMNEVLSDTSLEDFIFIVDVVFRGKPVVSRVLHGIPCAGHMHGWFSRCPFQIDLVSRTEEDEGHTPANGIEREGKDGRAWKAIWDDTNLSWIVINKKTNLMANLASWRPRSGQIHGPGEKDFLLRFGSVLPAHWLLSDFVVHCRVTLKGRLLLDIFSSAECKCASSFEITELSMQLEGMAGVWLNGRHSLLVLKAILSTRKGMNHHKLPKRYGQHRIALNESTRMRRRKILWVGILVVCFVETFFALFYRFMRSILDGKLLQFSLDLAEACVIGCVIVFVIDVLRRFQLALRSQLD